MDHFGSRVSVGNRGGWTYEGLRLFLGNLPRFLPGSPEKLLSGNFNNSSSIGPTTKLALTRRTRDGASFGSNFNSVPPNGKVKADAPPHPTTRPPRNFQIHFGRIFEPA